MAMEVEILTNNYQIPQEFAQRLLQFTKNDLEAAIKILESTEESVGIVKGKFLSSKKLFNGAFLFAYNFELREISYFLVLVSTDSSLSRINIEQNWKNFYTDLSHYAESNFVNMEISREIEMTLLSPENLKYIMSFFININNIDQVNLRRFLLSEIAKVVMDSALAIKTAVEATDIFSLQNFLKQNPLGTKLNKKTAKNICVLINLAVEPVLAPIGGIEIGNLEIGDEILVKLKDEREIAQFILNYINSETLKTGAIFGSLFSKELDEVTGNYGVKLEFGPGIFGSFVIGNKVRVQARKKTGYTSASISNNYTSPQFSKTKDEKIKPFPDEVEFEYSPSQDEKNKGFFEKGFFQTFLAILLILMFILIALLFFI